MTILHRNRQVGSALSWVLGILAIIVVLMVAGFWYVRENPLAVYERVTRKELGKAGMEVHGFQSGVGNLTYWEGGAGQTIVLLHGAGDQAGAFQGIVDSLLSSYRVLIPDLPGHGESEPADGPLSMNVVYSGLEEFLASVVGDQQAILVGSSMGAWLATTQAHRHPEAVERIILLNGGALTGERADLSLTPVDRAAARTLMEALRDPSSPPIADYVLDDIVEQSASGPIGRMMQAWEDFQPFLLDGRLDEVTVPVDLLWGESDQLMTLSYAERMAEQLPRARLTTIPACGHHPANECPAKLAAGLEEVLSLEPPGPVLQSGEGAAEALEPGEAVAEEPKADPAPEARE